MKTLASSQSQWALGNDPISMPCGFIYVTAPYILSSCNIFQVTTHTLTFLIALKLFCVNTYTDGQFYRMFHIF